MNWKAILVSSVCTLLGIALSLALKKPDPNRPVTFPSAWAPGQSLAATDIRWTELWGEYALTLNFGATKEKINFAKPEIAIVGICNELLDLMPHAPDGVERKDVYRVNIYRMGAAIVNYPLNVKDGQCLDLEPKKTMFPNYPPPLQDWQLKSYEIFSEGKEMGTTFVFASAQGTNPAISDQTFADACHAMLSEGVLVGRNITEYVEGKIARIKLGKNFGPAGLKFGYWQTRDFKILSGQCVVFDQDDKV